MEKTRIADVDLVIVRHRFHTPVAHSFLQERCAAALSPRVFGVDVEEGDAKQDLGELFRDAAYLSDKNVQSESKYKDIHHIATVGRYFEIYSPRDVCGMSLMTCARNRSNIKTVSYEWRNKYFVNQSVTPELYKNGRTPILLVKSVIVEYLLICVPPRPS